MQYLSSPSESVDLRVMVVSTPSVAEAAEVVAPVDAVVAERLPALVAESKQRQFVWHFPERGLLIQNEYGDRDDPHRHAELMRKAGAAVWDRLAELPIQSVEVRSIGEGVDLYAWLEGFRLRSYRFDKYRSQKQRPTLGTVHVPQLDAEALDEMDWVVKANFLARDLSNEPYITLNTAALAQRACDVGREVGIDVEIWDKQRIEEEGFGGLLGVNKGSEYPPAFVIMRYEPQHALNEQPFVLVGKGVVFDTGGLSLKPTKNSMDQMKHDMGGAAAVIGAMYYVAGRKLPIKVTALLPITDNRPGHDALTPCDIIRMHDGTTVEVLNTDAEGRLILADALAYAKHLSPMLTIDLATLTGAAMRAVGPHGTVMIRNKGAEPYVDDMVRSGFETYERIVELPNWPEYREMLKSDIADLKNIGGPNAGAITAGQFLEHFTDYPWIHLDIAGPAFGGKADSYRGGPGASGVGVRLLARFFQRWISHQS